MRWELLTFRFRRVIFKLCFAKLKSLHVLQKCLVLSLPMLRPHRFLSQPIRVRKTIEKELSLLQDPVTITLREKLPIPSILPPPLPTSREKKLPKNSNPFYILSIPSPWFY